MAITEASVPKVIKTLHDKTKNSHYPTVLHHTRTGISHAFFNPQAKYLQNQPRIKEISIKFAFGTEVNILSNLLMLTHKEY